MKKVLMICLIIVMAMAITVPAFAAVGGFVSSPSKNQAPELIEGKNEDDDCVSKLVITSFADRDKLPADARAKIESAYNQIKGVQYLDQLNNKISDMAEKSGVTVESLSVVDLFDISPTDCDSHSEHGRFNITLEPEILKNFVCLLHYYNGKWNIVEDAKVTGQGTRLEFTEANFSPFAIVVSSSTVVAPTEDNTAWLVFSGVASGVVAIGAGVAYGITLNIKRKKFSK